MTSWTITIDRPTPSLNETRKLNPFALQNLKKEWFYLLSSALNLAGVPRAHGQPRVILVERGSSGELDHDNLVGGAKEVLVDNLREPKVWTLKGGKVRTRIGTGTIVDDDAAWVRVTYLQVPLGRGVAGWTRITVSELEG